MGRRALLIGINHYINLGPEAQLRAAIPDAKRVGELLSVNDDGSPNYSCHILTSDTVTLTRANIRKALGELLSGSDDDALFYFSGHGMVAQAGGIIVAQDASDYDEGIPMDELLVMANSASEREVILILDCCMSGALGDPAILKAAGPYQQSLLRKRVSILAASRDNESAIEIGEHGLFSSLLIEALEGGASDFLGNVTIPALYAYIEGALGPWDQRPIFKTYLSSVDVLRTAAPQIDLPSLRQLVAVFADRDTVLQLAPEYEYDEVPTTQEQQTGALLKRYRNVGLIETMEPGQDLYWAAMKSAGVRLTRTGRYFWTLITNKLV